MTRRGLAVAALVALMLVYMATPSAGARYRITLESGATYSLEKVDEHTFDVFNEADEFVGSIKRSRAGLEVVNADRAALGMARYINPDALELIDRHVRGEG